MQTTISTAQAAFVREHVCATKEAFNFFESCNAQEQLGIALLWNLHSVDINASNAAQAHLEALGFWAKDTVEGDGYITGKPGEFLETYLS